MGIKRLLEYIISANPEIVGFSCYGWNVLRSYYLAKQIKKTLPECLIIFGGPEVWNAGVPNYGTKCVYRYYIRRRR